MTQDVTTGMTKAQAQAIEDRLDYGKAEGALGYVVGFCMAALGGVNDEGATYFFRALESSLHYYEKGD